MDGKFKITDEEILELIDTDLTQAKDFQSELSVDREEWYKRFRCAPYGNERTGWSQVVAPVVYTNQQSRLARMMDIFTDDFFVLKSDNADRASKFQKLIRYQMFRKQDGEKRLYDFLFNAGLYRYSVMKVYYKEDYDLEETSYDRLSGQQMMQLALDKRNTITKYEEVSLPSEVGSDPVIVYENVKIVRKEVNYAGPCMESLAPWAFGYSQDCKITNWGGIDGRLVYHNFRITLNEIKKRERAGLYKKGTFDACSKIGIEPDSKPIDQSSVEYLVDGTSEIITDGAHKDDDLSRELDAYECYVKLDYDKDGLLEPAIVTIIGNDVVAQSIPNVYKRPPFRIGCIIPEPHKVAGISPTSILENDAKIQTNLIRFAQDMASQSAYQSLITSDPRMQTMLQGRKPFDVILGDPTKVGEIPSNFNIDSLLRAIELTKGETEEGTGQSRYNQGLEGDSLNKTATGVSLISKAGDRRARLEAKQIGNGAMSGIIRDFIFINQKWPSDDPIRILGTEIEVSKDDLSGQFDIEIDVGVSPAEKLQMAQQVDLFVQFMTQVGLKLGMGDPITIKHAIDKKYALLGLNMDNSMYSIEQMQKNAEAAKQQPPKEDWREFVQIDKMYSLWPKSVQDQVTIKLGLQPDPNDNIAGRVQAKDILITQSKERIAALQSQSNQQELALKINQQKLDAQKNERDHKVKVAETLIAAKAKTEKNDNLQN